MHCKSYSHFFSKKFQHICVSLDVNFNESLTNDIVSFEQLGPVYVFLKVDVVESFHSILEGTCGGGEMGRSGAGRVGAGEGVRVHICTGTYFMELLT